MTNGALVHEADERRAEILMEDVGIDEGSRGVVTSRSNSKGGQDVQGDESESRFREVAATGNYLSQDRMDTQLAAKDISRFKSKPEEQDRRAAKRLTRNLKDHR